MLTLVIDCFLCSILLAGQTFEDADDDDADDDVDDVDKKPPMKKSKWGSTVTPPQNSRASFTTNSASLQVTRHFTMSQWTNSALQDMLTYTIPLTSGVDISNDNDIKVYVSENNTELVVEEKVAKMVSDAREMHEGFRKKDPNAYPADHPKIVGFNKFFSGIRKREGDPIYTIGVIPLPFPVQKKIVNYHRLQSKTGARAIYVDLCAMNFNDYAAPDESSVLMID